MVANHQILNAKYASTVPKTGRKKEKEVVLTAMDSIGWWP